jgi:hypothetical protein
LTWGSRNLILDIAGFLAAIGLSLHIHGRDMVIVS